MPANRAPFRPTAEQRQLVQHLAGFGIPQTDIRLLIIDPHRGKPISIPLLERVFREELDTGALKANAQIAGALYKKAIAGDTTAMIFWLKTRARWRETAGLDLTIKEGTEEDDARAAVLTQRLVAKLTAKPD